MVEVMVEASQVTPSCLSCSKATMRPTLAVAKSPESGWWRNSLKLQSNGPTSSVELLEEAEVLTMIDKRKSRRRRRIFL